MKQVRQNIPLRVLVWFLYLLSVFAAGFLGTRCLMCVPYMEAGELENTDAFQVLLEQREDDVVSYVRCMDALEQEASYLEQQRYQSMANQISQSLLPENTNFRFQLLSMDGTTLLYGNLDRSGASLEDTVNQVYYATLQYSDEEINLNQTQASSTVDYSAAYANSVEELSFPAEDLVLRYGVVRCENMTVEDDFYTLSLQYQASISNFSSYLGASTLLAVTAGALFLFLLAVSGYRPGLEGPVLSWQDHIFTEFYVGAAGLVLVLGSAYLLEFLQSARYWMEYMDTTLLGLLPAALGCAITGLALVAALALRTLAVRLKTRSLRSTTLVCRLAGWLWRIISSFVSSLSITWKSALYFLGYLILIFAVDHLPLFRRYQPIPGILINLAVLLGLCWWSAGFWRVRKGAQVIAAGNLNHQIDTARLPGDLKSHAEALNNISAGLTSAVNEQMKSERFKAELITNVSHDLKTPLTSIINYVNLLNTTEQTDPKAVEYIQVLERKSQRLKKLTEDLVEASKASTGALTVNRERISLAQLLDQALGEYGEKLEARQLSVVCTIPEGDSYVYADGRHLWRVMDNLLGNCAKYAMEGTRIYIELTRGKGSITLSMKNVSREPLNIPAQQLMERFVRGDSSRTTEGSGLGLSIARSLTELQGGQFHLVVDGDLFKAMVTLPQAT